eukprot:1462775-Rhodomonas_salina.1
MSTEGGHRFSVLDLLISTQICRTDRERMVLPGSGVHMSVSHINGRSRSRGAGSTLPYCPTPFLRTVLDRHDMAMVLGTIGTEIGYGATREGEMTLRSEKTLTLHLGGRGYAPMPFLRDFRYWLSVWCYRTNAVSGTALAYGSIGLRASYAMPGTDSAYGATR